MIILCNGWTISFHNHERPFVTMSYDDTPYLWFVMSNDDTPYPYFSSQDSRVNTQHSRAAIRYLLGQYWEANISKQPYSLTAFARLHTISVPWSCWLKRAKTHQTKPSKSPIKISPIIISQKTQSKAAHPTCSIYTNSIYYFSYHGFRPLRE